MCDRDIKRETESNNCRGDEVIFQSEICDIPLQDQTPYLLFDIPAQQDQDVDDFSANAIAKQEPFDQEMESNIPEVYTDQKIKEELVIGPVLRGEGSEARTGEALHTQSDPEVLKPSDVLKALNTEEANVFVSASECGNMQVLRQQHTPQSAAPSTSRRRRIQPEKDSDSDEDKNLVDDEDDCTVVFDIGKGRPEEFPDIRLRMEASKHREVVTLQEKAEGERLGNNESLLEGERVEVERDNVMRSVDQQHNVFNWSGDYSTFSGREETYSRVSGPQEAFQDPAEVFMEIWSVDIMEVIARETNEYARQKIACMSEAGTIPRDLETWQEVTVNDLYRFFAAMMTVSMFVTALSEFWNTNLPVQVVNLNDILSCDRYFLIRRFLRFVNNSTNTIPSSSNEQKMSKIRPILEHCNSKFTAMYTPTRYLTVDETLFFWKGRLTRGQFKKKAVLSGIRSYELCEAETGYQLKCHLYAGTNPPVHEPAVHGVSDPSTNVVVKLMDGFLDVGHCLVMENWYNQMPLTRYLKSRATDVVGTLNRRRVNIPEAIQHANESLMTRGDVIARHCGDMTLVAWKDDKLITTMSTFHKDDFVACRRAGRTVLKPALVQYYDQYIKEIDRKDQKLSSYFHESTVDKKWNRNVFKRLLNTSLLNAYVIYVKNPMNRVMSQRDFHWAVIDGMIRRTVTIQVPRHLLEPPAGSSKDAVRLDRSIQHMPRHTEEVPGTKRHRKQQCVRCTAAKRRTLVTIRCRPCNVPLCPGDCWEEYHNLTEFH